MQDQNYEAIQLEPFIHQVGGRSCMLYLDENTLCKPFIPREADIYKIIPDILKPFVPQFRGTIEVHFDEDQEGYIKAAVIVPKRERKLSKSRFRLKRTDSIDIEIQEVEKLFEDKPNENYLGHNPWVLKCHREHLSHLLSIEEYDKLKKCTQQFILLENLTFQFQYPCVLDLKMGTRHHTDDATPDKKQRHTAKAHSSTSAKLGIRLGGMQVYHTDTGKYLCHNKFYGRGLTVDGFKQTIHEYLFNGINIRTDVIPDIITSLEKLSTVFKNVDAFRFYTSSILIIYEGQIQNGVKCDRTVDVRVIDFAHTTHDSLGDPIDYSGPDQGFIFGIENLIILLQNILMNKDL